MYAGLDGDIRNEVKLALSVKPGQRPQLLHMADVFRSNLSPELRALAQIIVPREGCQNSARVLLGRTPYISAGQLSSGGATTFCNSYT